MGMWHNKRVACGAAALALSMAIAPLSDTPVLAVPAPAAIQDIGIVHQGLSLSAATAVPSAKKPTPPRDPARTNVLVNKKYPLVPKTYAPPLSAIPGTGIRLRPVAAKAYKKLVAAARKDGVYIRLTSGYRSYAVQKSLVAKYTRLYGSSYAQRIAAKPGTSEHQTGLAVDVGNPGGACALQACFASTKVGTWMARNAHKHGFILRYPQGMEKTTGYIYEPWHFRYVGIAQAKSMKTSKARTLEHHYGIASVSPATKPAPPKPSPAMATRKTTANLNMRRGPSTGAGIIKTVPKGSTVELTGKKSGSWVQARQAGTTGWMSSAYLR